MKDYIDKSLARILILDDELAFTDPISDELNGLGYPVHCVNNSQDAVREAKNFKPDVIFLDMKWCEQGTEELQKIQGDALMEELAASEALKGVPIVFLTNKLTDSEIQAMGEKFMGHHLWRKTANAEFLIDRLRTLPMGLRRQVSLHRTN